MLNSSSRQATTLCLICMLVAVASLLLSSSASSSQETNLEIATQSTCEELLRSAKTDYSSLVDIEYAIAAAFEERFNTSDYLRNNKDDPYLQRSLSAAFLKTARLVAIHRLFQNPQCPIAKDWYRYKPQIFTQDDWWFGSIQHVPRSFQNSRFALKLGSAIS